MSPRKSWLVVVAVSVLLCLCGAGRRGLAQTVDETGRPDSMLVYATDLEEHPERYARADQILVFGMESDRNIGRFRVKEGSHRFCLEGGAGFFTQIVLLTDRGSAWPVTEAGEGCVQAKLPAGIISVLLQHGDGMRPNSDVTTTVRVDPPSQAADPSSQLNTPLTDAKNSPIGGYWLIQDTSQNARGTLGLTLDYDTYFHIVRFLPIRNALDQTFLFAFPPADGSFQSANLPLPETEFGIGVYLPDVFLDVCAPGYCFGDGPVYGSSPPKLQLRDLGGYLFHLDGTLAGQHYGFFVRPDAFHSVYGEKPPGDTFQVLFRYYGDGSKVGDLRPGEVAVYDQCDFQGRAAVLVPSLGPGQVSPPFDLRSLSSPWWALNGTLRSVRVSKGTGAYWGTDPQHLDGGAIQDTACLPKSPENNLYVEPESNVLSIANSVLPKACKGCDFRGVPLEGSDGAFDFKQWDLTGAEFMGTDLNNVDFSGATLTDAKFTNAALNYVRFPGVQGAVGSIDFTGALLYKDTFDTAGLGQFVFNNARLCGTSLHGAGPNQTLDLTSGPFANALVQLGGDCATDLSGNGTNLSYSTFNLDVPALATRGQDWGAVNLTGAKMNSPAGTVLSSRQAPLLLDKALLAGVSMNGVVLDYAHGLTNKDLMGVSLLSSTLRHTVLKGAQLYGADLRDSNLEGANLTNAYLTYPPFTMKGAAQLQGAYLFNANLSYAQMSGADFTNASFFGRLDTETGPCTINKDGTTADCATAAWATIDDTTFSNAYLYGVDFSHITAQGVKFSGAYLVGSYFGDTTLSASSTGDNSSFFGAFLQGANLSEATVDPSITFQSAYFDFSPNGNVVTFALAGHTNFAGYWGTAGEPVCAAMNYGQQSEIPTLFGATVCPDGTQPGNGCGPSGGQHWNSDVPLSSSYTYAMDATYYNAAPQPACTYDPQWRFGPAQTQRPEITTGEQR